MIETATAINSFASSEIQGSVPTSEPIFVLTANQLKEIIWEATKPLQDRLDTLEKDIASLSDSGLIQLRLINDLREAIKKEPEEDSPILDELYKEMKAIGRKQTDFATAARMVRRSKARLFQLKAAIALDQRFILVPSESHSQKILIRLREFYQPV